MLLQVSKSSLCASIILTMMTITCCLFSRCHLHHITMTISITSRQYYSIPNTHHNQPRLPWHRHPPRSPYLKLRFCPIELRVRRPTAVPELVR
ncbi:uncharacterized protein F5891DRAFT_433977 [Suillus fuscotomentosus]|uniref:Uncharacterized protein n=1 Tax=Suillus fuscotomentosus TaxID=1912939 RepID=A0AAD4E3G8_9AGAM|nr:uncharacterized protein F5891DRAFT_433977 [Suillus fuscotomentosus]KAG1899001.1 hypothetical protein F5891DRAFT_433977 [Suillus fuscotomentosus]